MRCGALVTPAANKNNNRSANRYCGYLLSIFPFLYDDTNGNAEQVDHAPDRPQQIQLWWLECQSQQIVASQILPPSLRVSAAQYFAIILEKFTVHTLTWNDDML